MAGPAISHLEPRTCAPVIAIDQFCLNSGTSADKAASSKSETDMESWASATGLGCVRGTTLALTCELIAALGIYAIWQLLRILI
jgi:hypothetical protein